MITREPLTTNTEGKTEHLAQRLHFLSQCNIFLELTAQFSGHVRSSGKQVGLMMIHIIFCISAWSKNFETATFRKQNDEWRTKQPNHLSGIRPNASRCNWLHFSWRTTLTKLVSSQNGEVTFTTSSRILIHIVAALPVVLLFFWVLPDLQMKWQKPHSSWTF